MGGALSTQVSHGGGLAGPVVAQEGHDVVLVEVEAQLVQGQLAAHLVHLGELVDAHHHGQVAGLLLDAPLLL